MAILGIPDSSRESRGLCPILNSIYLPLFSFQASERPRENIRTYSPKNMALAFGGIPRALVRIGAARIEPVRFVLEFGYQSTIDYAVHIGYCQALLIIQNTKTHPSTCNYVAPKKIFTMQNCIHKFMHKTPFYAYAYAYTLFITCSKHKTRPSTCINAAN